MMRRFALIAAVIVQAMTANATSQQTTAATASLAGVVVNAVTGDPVANVQVTLARTDMPLGAIAQMLATGQRAPVEARIAGEMLAAMLVSMSRTESENPNNPTSAREKAYASLMGGALQALPIADIREIIISPEGSTAVLRKSLPPATTDSAGRFAFDGVEPGSYRVMFSAAGYARQDYGQRSAEGTGSTVALRASERRTDLGARLIPTGAVSGIVRKANGQPAVAVAVELLRFTYNESGQKAIQRAAATRTDDRGEYRMYYLTPGRYYLSAGGAVAVSQSRLAQYVSPNRVPESYGRFYYPGVPDSYAASTLDVRPGADITRIDLTLNPPQTYRIRGNIVDRRGGALPNLALWLTAHDSTATQLLRNATPAGYRPDGSFEFTNVSPGAYTITATVVGADNIINASIDRAAAVAVVAVSNGDVDGIRLELGNTGSISGTVRVDPAAKVPFAPSPFTRIHLISTDAAFARALGNEGQQWNVNPDGTFDLSGLRYGEYYLSINGLPPGFYLKEARFEQADVLHNPLRFAGTTSALELIVSPNSGELSGKVTPGARVVLIPAANRDRTELFKAVTADANGDYAISGIAPGDYILAAWEAIEPYAFFDPELIRDAEATGTRVHIAEYSAATLNVTAK